MTKPAPVGLIFPGQGTQREGMGAPWVGTQAWELVPDIAKWTGLDVEELLLRTGPDELRRTDLAQVAVFTVSAMAYAEAKRGRLFGDYFGDVVACAGHSLGEYTALVAAGALSLRDAAKLVAARGRAMRDAARDRPGTMGALVRADLDDVYTLTEKARAAGYQVWVANINAPGQVVVSGTEDGIAHLADEAPTIGAKLVTLQVGGAFHTPLMAAAGEQLRDALSAAVFAPHQVPVVANVDAKPHSGDCDWVDLATRQLTSPVLWAASVRTLTGHMGLGHLIELGPGRTLASQIRRIDREINVVPGDSPAALEALLEVAR